MGDASGTDELAERVWIGLCQVEERKGSSSLDGAPGAYIHAIARATSLPEYGETVAAELVEMGLDLLTIDDALA